MRFLQTAHVSLVFFALITICGCSAPESRYIGDAAGYQPPEHRTAVPLYCNDSAQSSLNNSSSPFRYGDERVDVEVDVVVDFRCPHCSKFARFMDDIWQRRSDFRNRVRIIFHHFPNEGIHPGATETHVASAAVANQGYDNFWRLHDEIFARMEEGEKMDRAALDVYIEQKLDLDFDQYQSDVEADATKDFVQWDKKQCRAADVSGTPSVFVCGALLFDRGQLEERIDEVLDR